ncbi:hypothetical protein [Kitasatospora sp. NPDC097691]|uniref:hypothetical protein n=1 Tax=Kitasatospora sp. NPDC097691 TaxID=3157231 RepID=UPI003326FFA1
MVWRNAEKSLLVIRVRPMDEATMNDTYGAGSETYGNGRSRLDFGPDVRGWVGGQSVGLGFRCDNPENVRTGRPYVEVLVSVDRVHRAVLDIALKYAKAVVADYPCSNPVRLPDSVPESAGNFPPPGP